MTLNQEKCQPCQGETPPLTADEVQALIVQIPTWLLTSDEKGIYKTVRMKDF